jgi:hypothetical protein
MQEEAQEQQLPQHEPNEALRIHHHRKFYSCSYSSNTRRHWETSTSLAQMAELPSFFPVYCKAVIDDDTDSGYTRERYTHTHTRKHFSYTDRYKKNWVFCSWEMPNLTRNSLVIEEEERRHQCTQRRNRDTRCTCACCNDDRRPQAPRYTQAFALRKKLTHSLGAKTAAKDKGGGGIWKP